MEIHRTAAVGFTKGAEDYEAARPTYPPKALDWAFDICGWASGSLILDLAAGTGELTRDLAARSRVIAVEPVEAMRQQFARVLPQVPMVAGVAEAIPVMDASFDGVTVAQAFHWFDSSRATHELHRVLRAYGSLMLIWNTRTRTNEVTAAVWDLVDSFGQEIPKYRDSVEHEGLPPTELSSR